MSDEQAERAVLAACASLGPGALRALLAHLEELLQVELDTDDARLRRVATALHQAQRILRASPSLRAYKRLRNEHPERGWPHPRSVTRWLGVRSWNDALVRLNLDPVLDGDTIEGAIGPTYSIDEVIQAVRDCAEDLGRPPTISEYFAWQSRPDVRERPGRRPASTWTFNRIFGGYPKTLIYAGLRDGDPTAAHPTELILRTANYRVTRQQLLDDMRDAAARTDEPLSATVYDRERRLIYKETRAAGRPRALAGVGTIQRHFGSWVIAREIALGTHGSIDRSWSSLRDGRHLRASGSRPYLTDESVIAVLKEALADTSGVMTTLAYAVWREDAADDNPARRQKLPTAQAIERRFGTWRAALRLAEADSARITPDLVEFTREQVVETVRRAYAELGNPLGLDRFLEWRDAQRKAGILDVPGQTTIYRLFGRWSILLKAAEVELTWSGKGMRLTDEQLLQALAEADAASTERLTVARYEAWRRRMIARRPSQRKALPDQTTYHRRFGGWPQALDRLREWRGADDGSAASA